MSDYKYDVAAFRGAFNRFYGKWNKWTGKSYIRGESGRCTMQCSFHVKKAWA